MHSKWARAQELEIINWQRFKDRLPYSIENLRKRAAIVLEWIRFYIKIDKNTKILEIGGAGMPLIDYIKGSKKYGLDPLAHHYKKCFQNIYKDEVNYISSQAENMPFKENEFDIVISLNVIDHVLSPIEMIKEFYRIMKNEGILVISVDTYSKIINIMRNIRINLGIKRKNDELHPHHFTTKEIFKLLKSKFKPLAVHNSVLDPLSMGNKRGYPIKNSLIAKIRDEQRFYFIGKKS